MKFISALLLGLLAFFCALAGGTERFYCNFYKGRDSVSDRMAVIFGTKSGRALDVTPFWTVGMRLYKTYDEGHEIITVYKERRENRYSLFKMDLSGPDPIFLYGYGLYIPSKDFERIYSLPFTKKNFESLSINPELAKYLPEKPVADYLSITFYKRKLKCRYINRLEYIKDFGRLILYYILAA